MTDDEGRAALVKARRAREAHYFAHGLPPGARRVLKVECPQPDCDGLLARVYATDDGPLFVGKWRSFRLKPVIRELPVIFLLTLPFPEYPQPPLAVSCSTCRRRAVLPRGALLAAANSRDTRSWRPPLESKPR